RLLEDLASLRVHAAMLIAALGGLGVGRRRLERLEHAEELADAADEQPFLVDLDPDPCRGREDDVIAGLHRHVHARARPPVQARRGGAANAIPWGGGGSWMPGGTTRPDRRIRSWSSSLRPTWSNRGRSWCLTASIGSRDERVLMRNRINRQITDSPCRPRMQ